MPSQRKHQRPRGTGSLYEYRGSWYGTWWVGGKQRKRKVGPKRKRGTRDGLTQVQAEARLRRMMEQTNSIPVIPERVTVEQACEKYIQHVRDVRGRKPSTVQDYEIIRRHFAEFFEDPELAAVDEDDILGYIHAKKQGKKPLAPKTINNHLTFLQSVFGFAIKRRWATWNPVAAVERPKQDGGDPDIRFLEPGEVEALVSETPDDELGKVDRVLYPTATMTGLRQGELVAWRWRDVDWQAAKVRVRQNIVRGVLGKPKSRTSSRHVPMTMGLARELERLYQRSAYKADDDYVFCHPSTGGPYDPSKMRQRFKTAAGKAGVREGVRFHDLRHTFGTRMAGAGTPMIALRDMMGHSSVKTTEIYAAWAPSPHEQGWAERAFGGPSEGAAGVVRAAGESTSEAVEPPA
jgi:integrase